METALRKPRLGLSYGLIAGLIFILITLGLYLGGVDMFMSPVSLVGYLVLITFAVLAALKARSNNGGALTFQEALKITFAVFVVSLFLHTVFVHILLNYIDIPFRQAYETESLKKAEDWLRRSGLSDEQIDKAMEKQQSKNQYNFGYMLLGYAFTCIIAFIFSLLISVIVKKNKPIFPTL